MPNAQVNPSQYKWDLSSHIYNLFPVELKKNLVDKVYVSLTESKWVKASHNYNAQMSPSESNQSNWDMYTMSMYMCGSSIDSIKS